MSDAELDASVRRVLAGLLAGGDPYTAMPLVDPVTKLLPPETVEAIRAPLASSLTELGADLDTVTETVGEHSDELAGRLSEQALSSTIAEQSQALSLAGYLPSGFVSGVTDVSTQVQQWLTDAYNAKMPAYAPPGVYMVNPLHFYTGQHIYGAGMWLTTFKLNPGRPTVNAFTHAAVLTNNNIRPADFGGSGARDSNFYIHDMCLDGNRANQPNAASEWEALSLYGAIDGRVERMRLINAGADGYDLDYCERISASDLVIDNCFKTGIHLSLGNPQGINKANNDCVVERAWVSNCIAAGLTDDGAGGMGYRNVFRDITIVNCKDETNQHPATASFSGYDTLVERLTIKSAVGTYTGTSAVLLRGDRIRANDVVVESSLGGGILISLGSDNTVDGFYVGTVGSNGVRAFDAVRPTYRNGRVKGTTTAARDGVKIDKCTRAVVSQVVVENSTRDGIAILQGSTDALVEKCTVLAAARSGIRDYDNTDMGADNSLTSGTTIQSCKASGTSHGIRLAGNAPWALDNRASSINSEGATSAVVRTPA